MDNFKEKMKDNFDKYSNEEYLESYLKSEFLTDDGDADIFLNINKKDELFDSKTVGKQLSIKKDIFDYIEEKSSILNYDIQLHLHIIGTNFNNKEKEKIRRLMHEHYSIELYKNKKEYDRYKRNLFILITIGLISFALYAFLFFKTNLNFSLELFCFIFSFALWEAFDYYIYMYSDIRDERNNIMQNLLMNIDFDNKEDII